ncbi:MAG: YhjD/YihY/BrkB family envelope integrity protein, partial [Phycisphaerales bacterium JB064]
MSRLPDWLRLPDAGEMARATHVSRMALRSLLRSRLPQMAAALAYRTLFGLLPISIVAVVIIRMFVSDADLERIVGQAMQFTGIAEVIEAEVEDEKKAAGIPTDQEKADNLFVQLNMIMFSAGLPTGQSAKPPPPSGEAPPTDEAGEPADTEDQQEQPAIPGDLDSAIKVVVQKLGDIRFDAIGLIGGLVLIYAALAMVVEVERCFNQICRAQSGRSWVRRITQYWTLLTLGAILIAFTFLVGMQVREWVRAMAGDGDAFGRFVVSTAGFFVTVAISSGLLSLAYIVLPNRKLRLRPVLAGATVAAVGWEAAKWGFTQYLGFATSSTSTYANLYGSLALIPLFMLWIFLTWLIILFGLQVAYGVQSLEDGVHQEDGADEPALLLAGPGVMIDAAAAIARRFEDGRSARTSDIADELALASDQTTRIIETLQRHGFVRQLDNGGGFTLSRPADKIRLADLAKAATEQMPSKQGSASAEMTSAAVTSLGEATLHSR